MKLGTIKINKEQKIIVSVIMVVVLLLVVLTAIGRTYSTGDSGYLETQTVENIQFSNGSEEYIDGIYTYKVEVKNTTNENINLKTIEVTFKDSNGNKIETLDGYIGDTLEPEEMKILSVSVDKEIKDINSISYNIKK